MGDDLVKALSKLSGVPVPKKMKRKEKKKFVEDSLDWLRENDPGRLDTVDDPTVSSLMKLAGLPDLGSPLSPDRKKGKAMQETLTWIRNNDPEVDDNPDEDLIMALSKVTGGPLPKKMNGKEKKKFVEDSIDWLRENDPGRLDTVDDVTAASLSKLAGIPYEGSPLSSD